MDDDSIKPKKSGDCYEKIAKGKSKEVDGPGVEDLEVLKNWIAQDPTDVEVWYANDEQNFSTLNSIIVTFCIMSSQLFFFSS